MIGIGVVVVAVAGATAGIWIHFKNYEKYRQKSAVLEEKLGAAEVNLRRQEAAFNSCLDANIANALEAANQKERAVQAEIRLAESNVTADRDVEEIERDELELRASNLACPAITSEFRSVFGDA